MNHTKGKTENPKTSYRFCPMARQLIFPMPEPFFISLIKKISSSPIKSWLNVLLFKYSYWVAGKERVTTTIEIDQDRVFLLIWKGHSERSAS